MIVLVTGSRELQSHPPLFHRLEELLPDIVIEGGARGADRLARYAAEDLGIHVATVNARWRALGKTAGHARNAAMLALRPDLVLAYPVGRSPGTRDCIRQAERLGITVEVSES